MSGHCVHIVIKKRRAVKRRISAATGTDFYAGLQNSIATETQMKGTLEKGCIIIIHSY